MAMKGTAAVVVGLVAGLILGAGWPSLATALEPVGTVWTNAIRMTVIPLVVALLVTGVAATADPKRLGRIGSRAVPLFVGLLLASGVFALLLAPLSLDRLMIPPEVSRALRASAEASTTAVEGARQMPPLVERLVDAVPRNPLQAAADGAMLPVVVFTLVFALALVRLDAARREPVVRVFQAVADAMLVVVGWVLAFAPVGIFALALGLGARLGVAAAGALLHYVVTLSAVLLAFTLLLYPSPGCSPGSGCANSPPPRFRPRPWRSAPVRRSPRCPPWSGGPAIGSTPALPPRDSRCRSPSPCSASTSRSPGWSGRCFWQSSTAWTSIWGSSEDS